MVWTELLPLTSLSLHFCPTFFSHTELKTSLIGKKKPAAAKKGVGGERHYDGVVRSQNQTAWVHPLTLLLTG